MSGMRLTFILVFHELQGQTWFADMQTAYKSVSHLHITAVGKSPCAVFGDARADACTSPHCKLLNALPRKLCLQGEWLSPRVINLSLQYLTHGLTLSATWKHMKQHINALLTRCVLPLMCFNDEDDELWREDPQEYIRKVVWIDAISQQYDCCCCLTLCSAVLLLCSPGAIANTASLLELQNFDVTELVRALICACGLLSHEQQVVCIRHGLCCNRDMTSLRTCTVPRRQPPILFKSCAGVEPKKTWRPCCSL